MAKEINLEELVKEYNAFMDNATKKWDAIYEAIENMVSEEYKDDIGSIIASAMHVEEIDPYEQLKIDFAELTSEIKKLEKARYVKKCPMCGELTSMEIDDKAIIKSISEWQKGNLYLQDIPLPPNKREFLKTGYCSKCQKLLFGTE